MDFASQKVLDIKALLEAGSSVASIMDTCHCSTLTISKVATHFAIKRNPPGPRVPNTGSDERRILATGMCAWCLLPYSKNRSSLVYDLHNVAISRVCETCSVANKIVDYSNPVGRRRAQSIHDQWKNIIAPQFAELSPIVAGDRFWRDSEGYKKGSYCYEDAPERQFKDEACEVPFPDNNASEVEFDAPDFVEPLLGESNG